MPLEERKRRRYSELWHNHCMSIRGKSYPCTLNSNTVNNDVTCVLTELAKVGYNKQQNSQVRSI